VSKTKVLLTGFDAFGGQALNASALAVAAVDPNKIPGARIVTAVLPTVFGGSADVLGEEIRRHEPGLVICVGQAGGRRGFSVERVAINIDDAALADNAGKMPIDQPITRGGPAAYFSTLPVKAIAQALHADDVPAEVSQTAGTFVCNHVFYRLMHALAERPSVRGGFIHIPCLPEQTKKDAPSLPLEKLARGLEIAVGVALEELLVARGDADVSRT
jgi:pyroglutamyl-peptidase